jgi:hypothetical protein
MAITFQGGQSIPAQGTQAYGALQSAQNSGTSGAGNFNPTTGALSVNSTPIYTPPSGGGTATTPVVTANNAQADYTAKLTAYNTLSQQIAAQGAQKASQALLDQQTAAQQALQASETNLKQQGIDIQKTQAQTQQQEAQAKADAVKAISSPTDTTTPPVSTTPAPAGTTAPQGATPAPTGTTPAPAQTDQQTALNTEQAKQQQTQAQKDSVAQQSISLLQSVRAGTIPLTGSQSALITSLQSQLQQNEAMQTQANNAYTGQVSEAAFRGGGEYTPAQMAGTIQNAVSVGVARIQQLDNSAAKTIADLEISFQKENYDVINKQYDILTKQLDDKAKAIKDTYDETTKLIQQQKDDQQKITDKISAIALDAAKNGATPEIQAAIRASGDESGAIAAAGNYLQTGSGVLGDYLQYKRDAESKGLVPKDYQTFSNDKLATEERIKNDAKNVSDAKFTSSDKNQQKLEQQGRVLLKGITSNGNSVLNIEDKKVNQANHLNSLAQQYYDSKTGNYNIPTAQYQELVLGLASLVANNGNTSEGERASLNAKTATSDINGLAQYLSGVPKNGNTQDMIKNMLDSIDRQATTAVRNRDGALNDIRVQMPTDLEPSRADQLLKAAIRNPYEGADRMSKTTVDNFVKSNPTKPLDKPYTVNVATKSYPVGTVLNNISDYVAFLYEQPGAQNIDVEDYLKARGYIQ